jgi:hypothetical protein
MGPKAPGSALIPAKSLGLRVHDAGIPLADYIGMRGTFRVLVALAGVLGCTFDTSGHSSPDSAVPVTPPDVDARTSVAPDAGRLDLEPALDLTVFSGSEDDLLNPERGLYDLVNLESGDGLDDLRSKGRTLAYAPVRLDAFRNRPLAKDFLRALDEGFARVRAAGIKVILRFAYNDCFCPDAPKERILAHIAQLGPTLAKHADVIAVLQAGFIGAWGEWHTSTSGLDNAEDQRAVLSALLAVLPKTRSVQVRTPMAKSGMLGAALTEDEAFGGSDRARTGHHNDCFLASESDFGTYAGPVDKWKSYVAAEGQFVPIGGETCALNPPRSSCATATTEMSTMHWSFLNALYHPDVLASWEEGGCLPEVRRHLGYRFALVNAVLPKAVRPGGLLRLEVRVRNDGYAAPYNARPVLVVLESGATRLVARLEKVDPRHWHSEASFKARLRIPFGIVPGDYRLALWMPDEADTLRERPEYAVRLANRGTWDSTHGDNVLAQAIRVDPNAGGEVDPQATDFREVE